jgi:hypothetical protein
MKHLLIGQNVLMRDKFNPFLRHAVHAAKIAAVGDREPQIVNDAFVVHLQRNLTFLFNEKGLQL